MLARLQALLLIVCSIGSLWLAAFIVSLPITAIAQASNPAPATTETKTGIDNSTPTGIVISGHDAYAQFLDNAQAGFMQIVTIPHEPSMDSMADPLAYLPVDRDANHLDGTHRTYAVSGEADDARTNVGCFEAWAYQDGPRTSDNYGEAFCISDDDMLFLFDHGAYAVGYSGY